MTFLIPLLFLALLYSGLKAICQTLDQANYERRRFELMVAEELDRLKEVNEPPPLNLNHFAGRN